MPSKPMAQTLVPKMIATVWTPKVKLNNRVSIQITKEELLYLCRPIIIFRMLQRQTNPIFRTRNLAPRNLSQINNPQELKNIDRETLMAAPVVSLELAWPTQTCKSNLKKNEHHITKYHTAVMARKRKI